MKSRFPGVAPVIVLVLWLTVSASAVLFVSFRAMGHVDKDTAEMHARADVGLAAGEIAREAQLIDLFIVEERLGMSGPARSERRATVESVDVALQSMRDDAEVVDFGSDHHDDAPDTHPGGLTRDIDHLRLVFLAYVQSPTEAGLDAISNSAAPIHQAAMGIETEVLSELDVSFHDLVGDTEHNRIVSLATGAVLAVSSTATILWLGRRMTRDRRAHQIRETALLAANDALAERNAQFMGLYHIGAEVTEAVTTGQVAAATVRGLRPLVDADLVTVRILDGPVLRLAGVTATADNAPQVAEEIELGDGPEGRAAERAKVIRVDGTRDEGVLPGAQAMMAVPLIVGARVVGTVGCWTLRSGGFSTDEAQVLELMASQVASAIASATSRDASEFAARHDPLTALRNRRQLSADITYEFDPFVARRGNLSVAMMDVDNFKKFNDSYGHHAGDVALERIAGLLASELRKADRVYRYGGEEFLIVFDQLSAVQAREACERLRGLIAAEPMNDENGARLTVSFGLADAPAMADTFDQLVTLADDALYRAKAQGRDRVCLATGGDQAPVAA